MESQASGENEVGQGLLLSLEWVSTQLVVTHCNSYSSLVPTLWISAGEDIPFDFYTSCPAVIQIIVFGASCSDVINALIPVYLLLSTACFSHYYKLPRPVLCTNRVVYKAYKIKSSKQSINKYQHFFLPFRVAEINMASVEQRSDLQW